MKVNAGMMHRMHVEAEISSTTNMAAAEHVEDRRRRSQMVIPGNNVQLPQEGEEIPKPIVKCMSSFPQCHEIKTFKNSPSDLKKHIKVSELSYINRCQCHFMWQDEYK